MRNWNYIVLVGTEFLKTSFCSLNASVPFSFALLKEKMEVLSPLSFQCNHSDELESIDSRPCIMR